MKYKIDTQTKFSQYTLNAEIIPALALNLMGGILLMVAIDKSF